MAALERRFVSFIALATDFIVPKPVYSSFYEFVLVTDLINEYLPDKDFSGRTEFGPVTLSFKCHHLKTMR